MVKLFWRTYFAKAVDSGKWTVESGKARSGAGGTRPALQGVSECLKTSHGVPMVPVAMLHEATESHVSLVFTWGAPIRVTKWKKT